MKKGLIVLAVLVAACFTRGIDAQNSAPYKKLFRTCYDERSIELAG